MANHGYDVIAVGAGNRTAGELVVSKLDPFPAGGGAVTSLSLYTAYCVDAANEIIVCVYDDLAGAPNNLIAQSVAYFDAAATSGKWVTVPISFTAVAGTVYHIGRQQEDACAYWYDSGQTGYVISLETPAFGVLSDPWAGVPLLNNYRMSAYLTYTGVGAAITAVPSTVARGETGLVITGTSFGATQGAGTVTFGGESCTVTSWADTSITVTVPSTVNLLYAAATHTFTVTADDASTDTSAAVPFTPEAGRSYLTLATPLYSYNAYMLYGYNGTPAPVTGDQLEYDTDTVPSSIANTPNADSEWILASMPVVDQTTDVQIIRAATSVRSATWVITWSLLAGTVNAIAQANKQALAQPNKQPV